MRTYRFEGKTLYPRGLLGSVPSKKDSKLQSVNVNLQFAIQLISLCRKGS